MSLHETPVYLSVELREYERLYAVYVAARELMATRDDSPVLDVRRQMLAKNLADFAIHRAEKSFWIDSGDNLS